MTAWGASSVWVRRWVLPILAAGFLAFSGAFGSGAAPVGRRLLYWLLVIGGGTLTGTAIDAVFERLGWNAGRPWRAKVLSVLATTVPTTMLVWALVAVMFGGGRFDRARLPGFALPVLAVTAVMVGLGHLLRRVPATTHAQAVTAAPAMDPPVRFLDRLPARLRGAELFAVQAEDHYLRLHTSRGSDLILMRLGDAVAELDGIEGAQVHRSWWVAREAVEGCVRTPSRTRLALKGGLEAPVSRSYVSALRASGWFDALDPSGGGVPGKASG